MSIDVVGCSNSAGYRKRRKTNGKILCLSQASTLENSTWYFRIRTARRTS